MERQARTLTFTPHTHLCHRIRLSQVDQVRYTTLNGIPICLCVTIIGILRVEPPLLIGCVWMMVAGVKSISKGTFTLRTPIIVTHILH